MVNFQSLSQLKLRPPNGKRTSAREEGYPTDCNFVRLKVKFGGDADWYFASCTLPQLRQLSSIQNKLVDAKLEVNQVLMQLYKPSSVPSKPSLIVWRVLLFAVTSTIARKAGKSKTGRSEMINQIIEFQPNGLSSFKISLGAAK